MARESDTSGLPSARAMSCSSAIELVPNCSTLYRILPSPVQRRIARLPSLRRSFSAYNVRTKEQETTIARHSWTGDLDMGFVEDGPGLASSNSGRCSSRSSVSMTPSSNGAATPCAMGRGLRHATHGKPTLARKIHSRTDVPSGINLLEAVVAGAQDPDPRNGAVSRQQYIHTTAYLLHGLPQDLTPYEATTIEQALPIVLQESSNKERRPLVEGRSNSRSIPRRILATGIVQLFLLFQLCLPFLQLLLRNAYQYDRTHRITERVAAASVSALDSMGKKAVDFFGAILRSGNGRGIQILAAFSVWWIKEVSSGIHEGVENCVGIADKRREEGTIVESRE